MIRLLKDYPLYGTGDVMSDSDYGKKLHENEDLAAFIIAYQRVTGEELQVADSGERPDYVCIRPNGQRVGVELTKVYASTYIERKLAEYREILGWEPITGYDLAYEIDAAAAGRAKRYAVAVGDSIATS